MVDSLAPVFGAEPDKIGARHLLKDIASLSLAVFAYDDAYVFRRFERRQFVSHLAPLNCEACRLPGGAGLY